MPPTLMRRLCTINIENPKPRFTSLASQAVARQGLAAIKGRSGRMRALLQSLQQGEASRWRWIAHWP